MQFGAMFTKKFHYFKRDKKGLCCELLFPFIMMLFPIYFNKIMKPDYPPIVILDSTMYDFKPECLVNDATFDT